MSHVIKTPNLSLFHGRRNTGKSTLMIHLLRTLAKAQKFAWVRVYSPTAFTGVWGNIVGEDNVEAVFDNDELESILESQAGIRSRGGKNEGLVSSTTVWARAVFRTISGRASRQVAGITG